MTVPSDLAVLSREDLLKGIAEQQRQIAELRARAEALQAEVERLKREGTRQAAPCSKGTRVGTPKRPGRQPGQGPFSQRAAPPLGALSAPLIEVPVTLTACPACGGRLAAEGVERASITELPAEARPHVRQLRVAVSRWTACGTRVRGQPPDRAPDQYGARAHRGGAGGMAAAHALPYGVGVPVRKGPVSLAQLTGVTVPQSALTQGALRRAEGSVGQADAQLRARGQEAEAGHTADTGWRVGGAPAPLRAFETAAVTGYQLRDRQRNEEGRAVGPADYEGVLVTDRGRSYEAQALAGVRQQKCLAHLQRALSEVLARQRGKARACGGRLTALLRQATDWWWNFQRGDTAGFAAQARQLQEALTHHLRDRPLTDPDNRRLLKELGWHNDRGNLLRFLTAPRIEPTNNRAERALRPAVMVRKVAQCSKSARGAPAFAAFTSVVRTLAKTGAGSVVEGLLHVFHTAEMPDASAAGCH